MDLNKILKEIKDARFYNINDDKKRPFKILNIGIARGYLFRAKCEYETTKETFYLYTSYIEKLTHRR